MNLRLVCCLLFISLSGAEPDAEKKEPPKPTASELEAARTELAGKSYARLQERYAAADVAVRSEDPSFVPLLFQAAVENIDPSFAVYAGEAANTLDPKAAFRAYETSGKLRRLRKANAVRFLGEVRTPAVIVKLKAAAQSKEVEARVEALYGLVKQKDESVNTMLVAALKSRDLDVKIPAAICCGLAKAKQAIPILLHGLEESKSYYANFCAWALGQMDDPSVLKRVVLAAKGRMVGDVGEAKAKAIVESAHDPQSHIPILVKLSQSSNESLASAAAWGLGRIGKGNAEAADALLALFKKSRSNVVSHIAVDALGRIGNVEHGKAALARYESNPGAVKQHAVKLLGLLGVPAAAPLLLRVAYTNRSVAVRKQAAIAYWQCASKDERASFRKKILEARGKGVKRGCLVLGFDRTVAGFKLASELLRKHYAKKSQIHVRGALERMTGHRFAPEPGIWKDWFNKNLDYFDKKPQLLNREAWRKQLLENKAEMGISKKTEAAVEAGLAWLARHQSLDGKWVGDKFYDRCPLFYRKKCQIGARLGGWDVGMSGIALLAFYGAGYNPNKGRYKDTVLRGQIYMAVRQWGNGDFGGQRDLIGGYTRPIATIALAEAFGTTQDKEYYERTWRSVSHLVRIQYADAGWRYRLGGQYPGDTSVTGWNAWAIATARKFGIPVDPMGLEGSNSLIDQFSSPVTEDEEFYNTDPRYFFEVGRGKEFEHFTGYNAREETRPPMTAI
ncbi:MAG: HEAT repeat domain-containing protein, partial [Planctomycetota bacterium]|nr:HEAT repeat domain-containing protein [Planctomycetota bacterium]